MINIDQKVAEHVCSGDSELSKDILLSSKPLVLRGLADSWPLVTAEKTSHAAFLAKLTEYHSGEPVVIYEGLAEEDNRVFYNKDLTGFNFQPAQCDFSAFCNRLVEHKKLLYMGSTMVDRWFPKLRSENPISLTGIDPLVSLWLGNQSRIAAHCDFPQNLAVVVAGNRRFTLFPPDQLENLYIGPLDYTPAGQAISLVDFHAPDFSTYPRFEEALKNAVVAELAPGDGIIIPSMWWHHVEGLSQVNGLVNYWWRTSPGYLGNPMLALKLAMLSIGQLPEAQKQAWRSHFEHFVFNNSDEHLAHIPRPQQGIAGGIDETQARQLRAELLNKLNR
ncbi:cupin-like domain-containing protein [Alteromonas ponticola]|uniref:Cupin-like domain-containing protein n=1 Tax=Alteromonas aquimaris TaxID=2998417 RepID=A0ABT3P3T3_9ALTE|nr:cupin-like domain-containing protein [Alteromonas aquimaris]MCW8107439.1 cupin-like domain-containing protein [Alteromonas aquimaris]